ncbi:hypothetical protein MTR_5g027610 [Medicago truncatula]|uniref:Uncharacterized protein n=1 Tax=Medicago truncatula TaxID=3880 RepID=G7K889_MEDTR|nr:hypothetical protein MTR_5g027610 [Medicago truncatula]
MSWLNCNFIVPNNLLVHLECWSKEVSTRKLRQGFWLIWHATLWVIWKVRNEIIFNNGTFDVEEVVENIKVLSWSWSLHSLRLGRACFMNGVGIPASVLLDSLERALLLAWFFRVRLWLFFGHVRCPCIGML